MRKIILLVLFLVFSLSSWSATVRTSSKLLHGNLMLGNVWSPLSLRVGKGNIEGGMLAGNHFGVVFILPFDKGLFASLGPTYSAGDETLGAYGSTGFEFWSVKYINFRTEIFATTSINNLTEGGFLFGLNVAL